MEIIKRRLEQSLERATETQNALNNLIQGLEHKLELSQHLFLGNNINCGQQQQQQQQQQQHFMSEKTIRRC